MKRKLIDVFIKMKFTLSWLKQFLDTTASAQQISDALNAIGLEVESVEDKGALYKPFIIAQIVDAEPHPNAEKLRVCQVNNGNAILQIVCGAANARAGIKVVLAPIGAIIPSNQLEIKLSSIRGVESNGMLCSADELSMPSDFDGIIELPEDAVVGSSFAEYQKLNEHIFDISITPNRGDAASIYGIARDLSSKGLGKLIPNQHHYQTSNILFSKTVHISDDKNCLEFALAYGSNVDNKVCPSEFARQLQLIGSSPKTPLVDISNYAMFSLGRPNHIYDADKIKGDMHVRFSAQGEEFLALNGVQYTLPEGLTVIADDEKVLSIAGVIGGELSKIEESTKNIIIEIANWDANQIIKAGRALNINTDSRFRFERRVDHGISVKFANFFLSLIQQTCSAQIGDLKVHHKAALPHATEMEFDFDKIKLITGVDISKEHATDILARLGFELKGSTLLIPTFRQGDIALDVDVVEEIMRIHGFDNIHNQPLQQHLSLTSDANSLENIGRNTLINRSYNEIISYSFCSPDDAKRFAFKSNIEIANPISVEMSVMRETIVPNMLAAMKRNEARGLSDSGFFEVGNIYSDAFTDKQTKCFAGLKFGKLNPKSVHKDERDFDFFDAKADLFALIMDLGFDATKLTINDSNAPSYYHPARSASFALGKNIVAYCGEIHPSIAKHYDANSRVVTFELFVESLPKAKQKFARAKLEVSDYQAVYRDFAFIVDAKLSAQEITKACKMADPMIESANIFDVYEGKNIEEGKKSIALSVKIQPQNKTLSDAEITAIYNKIILDAQIRLQASLR